MNKRHYEHTLPNIRGSLSNTYNAQGRPVRGISGLPEGMPHDGHGTNGHGILLNLIK